MQLIYFYIFYYIFHYEITIVIIIIIISILLLNSTPMIVSSPLEAAKHVHSVDNKTRMPGCNRHQSFTELCAPRIMLMKS